MPELREEKAATDRMKTEGEVRGMRQRIRNED